MASLMKIFEELQMIASKELQRDILPRFLTSKLLRDHEAGVKSPAALLVTTDPSSQASTPAAAAGGGDSATRSSLFSKFSSAASAAAAAATSKERHRTTSVVHTGKRSSRRSLSASRDASKGADGSQSSHTVAPLSAQQEVDRQLASGWGVGKQQSSAFDGVQSGIGSETALQERSPSSASHHSDGPHASLDAGGSSGGASTGPAISSTSAEALAVSEKLNKKTRIMGFGFKLHSNDDKARFKQLGAYLVTHAVKDGYVYKRGDVHPTWKRRWVVLAPCLLGYYESQSDPAPKGVVRLTEVTSIVSDAADELETNKAFSFALVTPARRYYMQASSERDLARWLQVLTEQWQAAIST